MKSYTDFLPSAPLPTANAAPSPIDAPHCNSPRTFRGQDDQSAAHPVCNCRVLTTKHPDTEPPGPALASLGREPARTMENMRIYCTRFLGSCVDLLYMHGLASQADDRHHSYLKKKTMSLEWMTPCHRHEIRGNATGRISTGEQRYIMQTASHIAVRSRVRYQE